VSFMVSIEKKDTNSILQWPKRKTSARSVSKISQTSTLRHHVIISITRSVCSEHYLRPRQAERNMP